MSVRNDDFEFLTDVLARFFKQKSIQNKLLMINENGIKDFEKWLQIELELFLLLEDSVSGIDREYSFQLDGRKTTQATCRVDLTIKQKRKQSWMAVEIKQKYSPLTCFKGMVDDYLKLSLIKKSSNDIRSMQFLGIHCVAEYRDEILVGLMKDVIENETDLGYDFVVNEPIGKTGFSFSLVAI